MRLRFALVVAVLGLALLALLVEFKRVWQRPRRGAEGPPLVEAEDATPPEPLLTPSSSSSSFARFSLVAATPHRPARIGIAHLKGRVVVPKNSGDEGEALDTPETLDHLEVIADDGRRTFAARIKPGSGRFELHLPPGRYTLTAHADDLVGVEPNIMLVEGVEREVTVSLQVAVRVSGQLHGASAAEALFLFAFRAGTKIQESDGEIAGDTFTFPGLRAGHAYDLVFGGDGLRTTTIRGVSAPLDGLDVTVSPLPILRGALGFPRGTLCPFTRVGLARAGAGPPSDGARGGDGDGDGEEGEGGRSASEVDAECRFELTLPADQPEVTVIAAGAGWDVEERISVPAEGDPDPICLNPPCRVDPLEGLGNLVVTLDVQGSTSPEPRIVATAGLQSCGARDRACRLSGLPVGEPIEVEARGAGCVAETRTMVLGEGENFVTVACLAVAPPAPAIELRRVQGVLRTGAGGAPELLAVRCAGAGGGQRDLHDTLVFTLICPRETAMLEYRTQREGPWVGVAIPAALDPALVEIAVGL